MLIVVLDIRRTVKPAVCSCAAAAITNSGADMTSSEWFDPSEPSR